MSTTLTAALIVSVSLVTPAASRAQVTASPEPIEGRTRPEVVRLFDAYAVVQAQEMLGLDEAQYGRFVTRFKALQATRRRNELARTRLLADLVRLTRGDRQDDPVFRDALKSLDDEEARAAAENRRAMDGVDDVLTWRQRARFRLFEEQMERKKIELMLRARQAARRAQRPGQTGQPPP